MMHTRRLVTAAASILILAAPLSADHLLRNPNGRALSARRGSAAEAEKTKPLAARNADTSGNSFLNGTYLVRQVLFSDFDTKTGRPGRARAINGPLVFDGKGGYGFAGKLLDSKTGGKSVPYSATGVYGVSSSGTMFIQNIIDGADTDYGGVGAVGPSAFVASATEGGYQDFLVGIPISSSIGLSSLTGSYRAIYMDYLQGDLSKVRDASFILSPDGKGGLGNVTVNGFAADQASKPLAQTVSNATYSVATPAGPFAGLSFGAASATQLISGNKTISVSPDGNLILGADPDSFDLLFAMRPFTGGDPNAGYAGTYLYATAIADTSGLPDVSVWSTYGSTNATGAGVALIHQRYFEPDLFQGAYDNSYSSETLRFDGSGVAQTDAVQEILGSGGQTLVGIGGGSFYALFVAFRARQYQGSGTYIVPTAVVNSANFLPITNPVAPGEFVTIFGAGLSPDVYPRPGQDLPSPLPTSLGGVQVTVNGRSAPVYFASPSQISFIVPFATGGTAGNPEPYANIQVSNNGTKSNVVSVAVNAASPGIWTSGANGISIGRVQKLPDYSLVSADNALRPGDVIVIYCTGLGSVTPAVADGAPAPANPLSRVDNDVWVYVDGFSVRPSFAGLTPGFSSLYQINATVPKGITRGVSVPLDIEVRDSHKGGITIAYNSEAKLPMAPAAGNIVATVAPDPVPVGSDGKWHYSVNLQENGGSGVTIKTMLINGVDQSSRITDFFPSHIAAGAKASGAAVSSNYVTPIDVPWQFTGVDDVGNALSWTATVRLR